MSDSKKDNVEDEEMEEGEASDSDEDVEVRVTLSPVKESELPSGGIAYGPAPAKPFSKLGSFVSLYKVTSYLFLLLCIVPYLKFSVMFHMALCHNLY